MPWSTGCGSEPLTLTVHNQTINMTSPLYPSLNPSDLTCNWLIQPAEGGSIFMKFIDIELTSRTNLRIGYGHNDSTPLMEFTGDDNKVPRYDISFNERQAALIQFITERPWFDSSSFRGFHIEVTWQSAQDIGPGICLLY